MNLYTTRGRIVFFNVTMVQVTNILSSQQLHVYLMRRILRDYRVHYLFTYMYVPMNQGFHILIMLCMSDLHIGHRVDLFAAFIPAVHPEHNAK